MGLATTGMASVWTVGSGPTDYPLRHPALCSSVHFPRLDLIWNIPAQYVPPADLHILDR